MMSPAILLAILAAAAPGAHARYATATAASVQVSAQGRPLVLEEPGTEASQEAAVTTTAKEDDAATTQAEVLNATEANKSETGATESDVLSMAEQEQEADDSEGADLLDDSEGAESTTAAEVLSASEANVTEKGTDEADVLSFGSQDASDAADTTEAPTELLQGDDTTEAPTELLQGDTTEAPSELVSDETTQEPSELVRAKPSSVARAKHGTRAKKLAAQGDDSGMEEVKSKGTSAKKTKMTKEKPAALATAPKQLAAAQSAKARKLIAITSALVKVNEVIAFAQNISSQATTMIGEDLYLGQDIANSLHLSGGLNAALFKHGADMVPNQDRLELKVRELDAALGSFKVHYNDVMPAGRSVPLGA